MTDGTVSGGRHEVPGRVWTKTRLRFALLLAAVAVTSAVVPPLIVVGGWDAQGPPNGGSEPRPVDVTLTPSAAATSSTSPSAKPSTPSPSSEQAFTPIVVEAEAPSNILHGGAEVVACAPCQGGYRVRYLGVSERLEVPITIPVGSERRVSIVYECDGSRRIKVSINGTLVDTRSVIGASWETPLNFSFTTHISAGPVVITLFNDESNAPDIDAIIIS
jgi:hypothetical protein